ncbi:MAG: hypothetical protein OCD76_15730 [Reichenbachiella sp.]
MNLIQEFQKRFPEHSLLASIVTDEHSTEISLNFKNQRYRAWVSEDKDGLAVGINELHNHYDLGTRDENLSDALDELAEIVTEQIAAVGLKHEESNFLLATLELHQAIESYSNEKPKVEIVTFRTEH